MPPEFKGRGDWSTMAEKLEVRKRPHPFPKPLAQPYGLFRDGKMIGAYKTRAEAVKMKTLVRAVQPPKP